MAADQLTKLCTKCQQHRQLPEFCKDKSGRDGLSQWCKGCRAKNTADWQSRNPDAAAKRQRRWRALHRVEYNMKRNADRAKDPEKFRAKERERYRRNPLVYRAKRKRNRLAHPDRQRMRFQRYYQKHKAKYIAVYVRGYRARKRKAPGHYTPDDVSRIEKSQRGRCALCRTALRGRFHVDHITPLAMGGSNWPRNLQLLCVSCNCSKGGRDPLDHARHIGRLL